MTRRSSVCAALAVVAAFVCEPAQAGVIRAVTSYTTFDGETRGPRQELLRHELESSTPIVDGFELFVALANRNISAAIRSAIEIENALSDKVEAPPPAIVRLDAKYDKVELKFWTETGDAGYRIVPNVFADFNSTGDTGLRTITAAGGTLLLKERRLRQPSGDNIHVCKVDVYPRAIYESGQGGREFHLLFTTRDARRSSWDLPEAELSILHEVHVIVTPSREAEIRTTASFSRSEFEGVEPVNHTVWSNQLSADIAWPSGRNPVEVHRQGINVNVVRDTNGKYLYNDERYTSVSLSMQALPQPGFGDVTTTVEITPPSARLAPVYGRGYVNLVFAPGALDGRTIFKFRALRGPTLLAEHSVDLGTFIRPAPDTPFIFQPVNVDTLR